MYHVPVPTLPQEVTAYIHKHDLLKPGDRVGVAVSGGADSVALLRLLLDLRSELGIVLSVAHFNHRLRGAESEQDEQFVAELAKQHKLEFHHATGDVRDHAARKKAGIEAAARNLRYGWFRELLLQARLTRIATAHTLDDQAETVLLRISRGAGTRGLAGIYPRLSIARQESPAATADIIRPLLETRRKELEAYLSSLGQNWREDSSNRDLQFARNRIRHAILPRLERDLNPSVREALAESAEIARAEEAFWISQIARLTPQVWHADSAVRAGGADIAALLDLPLALRRRVIRAICESLDLRPEFRHVEEVLDLVSSACEKAVLPHGWIVSRVRNELRFERALAGGSKELDYEYCLPVPGVVEVRETGSRFETVLIPGAQAGQYNREDLVARSSLEGCLRVRNWRAGDRFWPAHTKAPKKIKELLQERRVRGPQRKLWPVVVSGTGETVVWLRGFSAWERQPECSEQVLIREVPLEQPIGYEALRKPPRSV